MSDPDQPGTDRPDRQQGSGEPDDTGVGLAAEAEKTPHKGPDVNDLQADNAVEEETIESVDPDNAPA